MRVFDLYSCKALAIDRAESYISGKVTNCQFSSLNRFIVCYIILSKNISLDEVFLYLI